MRVLNLSTNDYANFAHDNAKALRAVGVDCVDLKTKAHQLGYTTQSKVSTPQEITKAIDQADLIQIFHSDLHLLSLVKDKSKRVVVYHTGTNYRDNSEKLNKAFNKHVETSIIALSEFSGLGAKNETYVVGAIDCDNAVFDCDVLGITEAVKIAHYPSNPEVKGTREIVKMMLSNRIEYDFDFTYSSNLLGHSEQSDRLSKCHVYIELFKPVLRGKTYGSWGITALEAAKLGKIVITQNLNKDVYFDSYGDCPLLLANTPKQFYDALNVVTTLNPIELKAMQKETFDWVTKNHSYIATGNKIKSILNL